MEDEKRIIHMKQVYKVILNVVLIIIGLFLAANFIYDLFTNTLETFVSIIFNVAFGAFIYLVVIIHDKLISKSPVEWNTHPALKSIVNGICIYSGFLSAILCVTILDYIKPNTLSVNSSIKQIAIILIMSLFSWWTYLSIAYAKRSATILLRGFMIMNILYFGLPLINSVLNSTIDIYFSYWNSIETQIFVLTIVSICIKGLCTSFSKSWKEQFKNSNAPFIVICTIVAISYAIIRIRII